MFPIFKNFNERVRAPGGFRLPIPACERIWSTPDKKAHLLMGKGMGEDGSQPPDALTLTTIRSHDQYNTTIYGMDDRYRGITGRRDVIFIHLSDLADRGLEHGDRIDVKTVAGQANSSDERAVRGFTSVAYEIAQGSVAMYYPEGNSLVALENYDERSGASSYKSVPVKILAARDAT